MTESIQTMARRLDKAFKDGGAPAADVMVHELVRLHGRDVALAVFDEMERQHDFEWEEARAEHAKQSRFHAQMMRLFKACPEAKTTEEVCRIMASRGDPFAAEMLAWLGSHEYRLGVALDEAAAELHPGWRREGDGTLTKLDKNAPETGSGLQEWLYKNHPARARAIEQSVAE